MPVGPTENNKRRKKKKLNKPHTGKKRSRKNHGKIRVLLKGSNEPNNFCLDFIFILQNLLNMYKYFITNLVTKRNMDLNTWS